MTPSTTIKILAAACVAELVVIVYLVGMRPDFGLGLAPSDVLLPGQSKADTPHGAQGTPVVKEQNLSTVEVSAPVVALETKLAEVTKELSERKSEISFSYGSLRDSGRFVGMTFRKMFETAAASGAKEAQARMADNQINVLSLGPFIQDAEVMESDPVAFAQFQTSLISEVLGLPPERGAEMEAVLSDLKTRALKVEEGSAEWSQLNDAALQKITAMMTDSQRQAMKPQLNFLQQYGVLVIPAYSILKSTTPTVAVPGGTE